MYYNIYIFQCIFSKGDRGEQLKRSADAEDFDESKTKKVKIDDDDTEISVRVLVQSRVSRLYIRLNS